MDVLTIRSSFISERLNVSCVGKAEKNKEIILQTLPFLLLHLKLLTHMQQCEKY
jgi:hypothetical protein